MITFTLQDQTLLMLKDGKTIGKVDFHNDTEDILDVYHIEANPEFRGQNLGQKLLDEICSIARDNHQKIIPSCPYAQKMLKRYPERYGDVIISCRS